MNMTMFKRLEVFVGRTGKMIERMLSDNENNEITGYIDVEVTDEVLDLMCEEGKISVEERDMLKSARNEIHLK